MRRSLTRSADVLRIARGQLTTGLANREEFEAAQNCLLVDGETRVHFSRHPERVLFANYEQGDVSERNALTGVDLILRR